MRTYGSVRGAISDGRPYRDSDPRVQSPERQGPKTSCLPQNVVSATRHLGRARGQIGSTDLFSSKSAARTADGPVQFPAAERSNAACYRLVLEGLGQKACRACAGFRSVSNGASPPQCRSPFGCVPHGSARRGRSGVPALSQSAVCHRSRCAQPACSHRATQSRSGCCLAQGATRRRTSACCDGNGAKGAAGFGGAKGAAGGRTSVFGEGRGAKGGGVLGGPRKCPPPTAPPQGDKRNPGDA